MNWENQLFMIKIKHIIWVVIKTGWRQGRLPLLKRGCDQKDNVPDNSHSMLIRLQRLSDTRCVSPELPGEKKNNLTCLQPT